MISETINIQSKDKEIWQRFKLGEIEAFNIIFEKYVKILLDYGRRFCPDKQLLEDCVQETYTEIWMKKDRLSSTDSIKYYLFKSFKRKVYRRISKELNRKISDDIIENSKIHQDIPHEGIIINRERENRTNRLLHEAVNSLSIRQKEAIKLRFYKELSFQEVSGAMGIGMKSTYRVISSAIEKLQCTMRLEKLDY